MITHSVPLINNTVATPLVANETVAWSVFVPAMYAVVIVQVIVKLPDVLLYSDTTSPAAKVELGMVIPADKDITLPTSLVAIVVVVELTGTFRYPSVVSASGSVAVRLLFVFADCNVWVPVPLALPCAFKLLMSNP